MFSWLGHERYIAQILKADREHRLRTGMPLWDSDFKILMTMKMLLLDPDPLMPLFQDLYPYRGVHRFEADVMLRSYMAFVGSKGTTEAKYSIDAWSKLLKHDPFYRTLAGCPPKGETPSCSTHYDFSDRLWMGDRVRYGRGALFDANKNSSAHKQMRIGEDNKVIEESFKVKNEYDAFRSGMALSYNYDMIHQQIVSLMGVYPSMEYGCIPAVCSCSMDSTAWYEHASPFGTRHCGKDPGEDSTGSQEWGDCKKNHMYCPYRKDCGVGAHFSAVDGSWGYDSGKKTFFFGEHVVVITAYSRELGIDIPICATLMNAQRHDSITFFTMMQEYLRNVPFFHMDYFDGDMAYDHDEIVDTLYSLGTIPVIYLKTKSRKLDTSTKGICVDTKGRVCCSRKVPLTLVNNNYDTHTWEYRCPLQTGERADCPKAHTCPLNRKDAPLVVVDPMENVRICGVVPRDHENFRLIMANRSSSERINTRELNHYHLEEYTTRNADHRTLVLSMAMLHTHADAWIKCGVEPKGELQRTLYNLLLEDAKKINISIVPKEKPILIKAKNLKPVEDYVEALRVRNAKERAEEEERQRKHTLEMKLRRETRKVQPEDWVCPRKAEEEREAKQEVITAENMPPISQEAAKISISPVEQHSKKQWEIAYVDYEAPQVVIDSKGNIKPDPVPEPKEAGYSNKGIPESFVEFPPTEPKSRKKRKEPEVVNGYEKADSGAWVGPRPTIYKDPEPPQAEERKTPEFQAFDPPGSRRLKPILEVHTPDTFQFPPLFGTNWDDILFNNPGGVNAPPIIGGTFGSEACGVVFATGESATPGAVIQVGQGGGRASPVLKPDRSFCRMPTTKEWAMAQREKLYFTKGLIYA